jgi:hypothetical protein
MDGSIRSANARASNPSSRVHYGMPGRPPVGEQSVYRHYAMPQELRIREQGVYRHYAMPGRPP